MSLPASQSQSPSNTGGHVYEHLKEPGQGPRKNHNTAESLWPFAYPLWIDLGAQLNLIFKHWFNLESTLSAGVANAWYEGGSSWEWFVSYKLLRN